MNRNGVTHITHALVGDTRTFDYGYDNVGNRNWTKRDLGTGDVFGYDANDQVTAVKLNIANPDTTSVGAQTIVYDANGNRTTFSPYGTTNTYSINNLNEYTTRNSTTAAYNTNADLTTGLDGSIYAYDAQDRVLSATKSGTTETFKYDGLNRQVSRTVAGTTTYNVYDGWDLIEEYQAGGTVTAAYLHGAGGLVKNLTTNNYYYQDASGSTSHLADGTGHLLEWYRYDLQGTPVFYNFANTQQSASAYGVRHLFTGQQWYAELGLYDLRNRFYSPDIGRFLQPDPSGFWGDRNNLYRYCRNNAINFVDPLGLFDRGEFGRGAVNTSIGGIGLGYLLLGEVPSAGVATIGIPLAVGELMQGLAQIAESFKSDSQHLADTMVADPYNAIAAMTPDQVQQSIEAAIALQSISSGLTAAFNDTTTLASFLDIAKGLWDLGKTGLDIMNRTPPEKDKSREPFSDIRVGLEPSGPGGSIDPTFGFPGFSVPNEAGPSGVDPGAVFYGPGTPSAVFVGPGDDDQMKLF